MPRVIEVADARSCTPEECIEGLRSTGYDPRCEESTAHAAGWLRRLGNNRSFLGDMLVDELAGRSAREGLESGYTPQAIVLSRQEAGFFMRANIWPAPGDYAYRASGAHNFVYGTPHDHNFDFLTVGYFGPGYRSDYYEYDYEAVDGWRGEAAGLRFVERSALHEGKLMHYRALRDVHSQIPPESLSISLNIIATDPMQGWLDQYGFDLETGTVSAILNPGSSECLLRLAVGLGGDEAIDLAHEFGRSHPSDRMRLAAYEARSLLAVAPDESDALWRDAELAGSRLLAVEARRRRAELSGMAAR
ncbi:MAG: transposase [Sphingomonadales bacterium]|nr:transposase [Sphingomonadales bacterium]MBD3773440.1 transposase [Paracoccaceae bacterium]